MQEQFIKDVDTGLSRSNKTLPSKYFYNEIGDALFVEIMHCQEYYLTRSELEIFQTQSESIIDGLGLTKDAHFELIELGAGDGLKTKELLKQLEIQGYDFAFHPVDISQNALDQLQNTLEQELPNVCVQPRQGDYFEVLKEFKQSPNPKVILFLGSNIGNLNDQLAADFIYQLGSNLRPNDKLFLGVDLIKASSIVLPAYNDQQGFTRDFNLNLLQRINDELGGNFDLNAFFHLPEYDEQEGIARSYLVSSKAQEVYIEALDKSFKFEENERIHTETSRKYNEAVLSKILAKSDFKITAKFTDSKAYFANFVLTRE